MFLSMASILYDEIVLRSIINCAKAMSIFKNTVLVSSISLALAGCAGQKPQPVSKEEASKNLFSTLNIYENNQVYFSKQHGNAPLMYVWTENKDSILAIVIDGKSYNIKDVSKISPDSDYRYSRIYFKEDKSVVADVNKIYFTFCSANKVCGGRYSYNGSGDGNFKDIMKGVYGRDLAKTPWDAYLKSPSSSYFMTDGRIMPSSGYTVTLLSDSQISEIKKNTDRFERDVKQQHADAKAREEQAEIDRIEKEKAIQREAEQMRKTIGVGTQTNCGKVFHVNRPMAGVQTMIGQQYIDISTLFGPSATCRFLNNVYIGR